jgi:hypothetical protein
VFGESAPVFGGNSAATETGDVTMKGEPSDKSVIESLSAGSRTNAFAGSSAKSNGLAAPTQYPNQETSNQILGRGLSSNNFQTNVVSTTKSHLASLSLG